jgi:subtilisin-like proprotein convertase family protein
VCGGGADADADAPAEADAEARVDEAAVDDARADDGAGDDARDEAPVDEGVADEAGREDTGGATWGEPVCDTTGGTLRDRAIVGSATTLTRSLAVPDLGNGRVVRLDIEIPTRRFLGISIPFDDLQATLTSPTGEARKFWYHFEGDSSGGLFPVYDFDTPWTLPVWWDAEVGGTWTLMLRDDEFTGAGTTLSSWCLTPLDPALHASTDPGAHLGACDGEAHDITDYCEGDEPDPCTDHPVQFEMAVGDLVRAAGAARLVAEISHSDVSDLVISVVAANGTEITVWDRDPASAWTSTIALPTLDGVWLTGRWAIRIVDEVQYDTGTLNRWCIEAN